MRSGHCWFILKLRDYCSSSALSTSHIPTFLHRYPSILLLLLLVFLSLVVLSIMYSSNMPTPKKQRQQNTNLLLLKNWAGFGSFPRNPICGKYSVMLATTNKMFGNPSFKSFEKQIVMNIDTQTFRGHAFNTSKKETPQPKTTYFIVFCYLHFYMKPFFRHPTRILRNTTETHRVPELAEVTSETNKGPPKPILASNARG